MAYTSDMLAPGAYLIANNVFTTLNEPLTVGGHFRMQSFSGLGTSRRAFCSLHQGSTNLQTFGFGVRGGALGARDLKILCYDGGTLDDTEVGVDYVENEWWFIALVANADNSRTLYWQAPGDASLQSAAGSSDTLTIINVDSIALGSRNTETAGSFTTEIDAFQVGVADSALGTDVLQDWADETAVETLSGMTHAWPMTDDFNDAIGSADFVQTNGTVTNVTNPFTPQAGSSPIAASPSAAFSVAAPLGAIVDTSAAPSLALTVAAESSADAELNALLPLTIGTLGNLNNQPFVEAAIDLNFLLAGDAKSTAEMQASPDISVDTSATMEGSGELNAGLSFEMNLSASSGFTNEIEASILFATQGPGSVELTALLDLQATPDLSFGFGPQLLAVGDLAASINLPINVTANILGQELIGLTTETTFALSLSSQKAVDIAEIVGTVQAFPVAEVEFVLLLAEEFDFSNDVGFSKSDIPGLALEAASSLPFGTSLKAIDIEEIVRMQNALAAGIIIDIGVGQANEEDQSVEFSEVVKEYPPVSFPTTFTETFNVTFTGGLLVADNTWEDDDVAWGGTQLQARNFAPVYTLNDKFYLLGYGTISYVDTYLERRAVINERGNEILAGHVWPQIEGPLGTDIQIYLGSHETPDGAIDWEGPFNFTIGVDTFADFSISGKYIAIRFESSGIPKWTLQSYDIDYEVIGVH